MDDMPQTRRRALFEDYAPPAMDAAREAMLAAAAVRGDRDALAALYDAFAATIFASAHRLLGERSDAEDATHEVFVAIGRTLERWDPERGTLGPFLRRVAVRIALMRLRSSRRRREVSVDAVASLLDRGHEPHDRLSLDGALARLSEEHRVVFLLKEVEGYSHAEIAGLLEISVRNSEVRLFRARQSLRALLGGSR